MKQVKRRINIILSIYSFKGSIGRATYLLCFIINFCFLVLTSIVIHICFAFLTEGHLRWYDLEKSRLIDASLYVLYFFFLVLMLPAIVRRVRDLKFLHLPPEVIALTMVTPGLCYIVMKVIISDTVLNSVSPEWHWTLIPPYYVLGVVRYMSKIVPLMLHCEAGLIWDNRNKKNSRFNYLSKILSSIGRLGFRFLGIEFKGLRLLYALYATWCIFRFTSTALVLFDDQVPPDFFSN